MIVQELLKSLEGVDPEKEIVGVGPEIGGLELWSVSDCLHDSAVLFHLRRAGNKVKRQVLVIDVGKKMSQEQQMVRDMGEMLRDIGERMELLSTGMGRRDGDER